MRFTAHLQRAVDVAARAHRDQVRKDPAATPYVSHPYGVAMMLAQFEDISEDVIIAGLLHDVIEDVDPSVYSAGDIERDFGPAVLAIIREVSDDRTIKDWHARKAGYLKVLENASKEALQVSAADMINNCRSIIENVQENAESFLAKFQGTPSDMVWFYQSRAGLIHAKLQHPLAEAAIDVAAELEQALSDFTIQEVPA